MRCRRGSTGRASVTAMKRNYVGLATSFHDSALAIVDSHGEVLFAEATERPLQNKRSIGITPDLVHHAGDIIRQFCEPDAQIVTACSWAERPPTSPAEIEKPFDEQRAALESQYARIPDGPRTELISMRHAALAMWKARTFSGDNLDFELNRIGWPHPFVARRRAYPHHLTHAAFACFSSPYEEAVCAVLDGVGEDASCAFFSYRNGELREIAPRTHARGSLGFFYTGVCIACGFGILTGEEWKVMGLAPYGEVDEELARLFRRMIRVDGLGLDTTSDLEDTFRLYGLRRKAGEPVIAAANIARTGQHVFGEVLFELLGNLANEGTSGNLVLTGGCALNSSASGRILDNTPFTSLFVPCAPGDDGNAIGAALLAYREDNPDYQPARRVASPYLGSRMSAEVIENVRRFADPTRVTNCHGNAPQRAARLLAEGQIIGWIQGRAEFGPRALGNRSILADPRSAAIKERINARVKFREEFRPFAPSVLHECGPEYFERYQESPYMERTLRFRPEVMQRVPGVVHVDGTGRLQSVKKEWNPRFHALISEFRDLTGVPLVLNTSFNVMGKPIAHSVEDVLAVFHSSGLDAVFIDELLIEK